MLIIQWRKKFIRDPSETYSELITSAPNANTQNDFVESASTVRDLAKRIADLSVQKGQQSRAIGKGKKQGENVEALISQVGVITREMDSAVLEIDELLSHFNLSDQDESSTDTAAVKDEPKHRLPAYLQNIRISKKGQCTQEQTWTIDDSVDDIEWNQYVNNHIAATCYHNAEWKRIYEESFHHETHYIGVRDKTGALGGVLPLVHVTSRLFEPQLVSLPFVNYGGALVGGEEAEKALLSRADSIAEDLSCRHLELRETFTRPNMPERQHKVTLYRELPSTDEQFESSLGSKVRAQCKRALRADAKAFVGGREQLDNFYQVFSRNMRDVGTPVLSKDFFHRILTAFELNTFIVTVCIDGEPVAAAFLIGHNDALEVPWASSLRKHNKLSVNMLLYRNIFKEAISRNYRFFDFGRSSVDSPTYQYKRQWGALPLQLYWHYWLNGHNTIPDSLDTNLKYRVLRKGWQCSPVWVTNWIGPKISAGMP